jgi:hypothetical protein
MFTGINCREDFFDGREAFFEKVIMKETVLFEEGSPNAHRHSLG